MTNAGMPTAATPSRSGLLGRFGWQSRHISHTPPAVSVTTPETPTPQDVNISAILSENAGLKTELKRLRQRCEEFQFQSAMNQDMMQECVTASKRDIDQLSTENERLKKRYDQFLSTSKAERDTLQKQLATITATANALTVANKNLKIRCEELTTQSQANKDILHASSKELANRTADVKSLQASLRSFSKHPPSDITAKDAEITAHKETISYLQSSLFDLQEKYMSLEAMGCVPGTQTSNIDLTRRIAILSNDNFILQEKLEARTATTKTLMLDYATELNDLTDQLRIASTDASTHSSSLKARDAQFLALKAEFDAVSSELDTSRRTSKRFTAEFLRRSQPDDVLVAQLASLHATAVEREKLVVKFREQCEVLVRAVESEQGEKERLVRRIEELCGENRGDRKGFEEVLRRRDRRIRELERVVRRGRVDSRLV